MKKLLAILSMLVLLGGQSSIALGQTRIFRGAATTSQVEGTTAEGAAFLPNPILIGGDDGTDITNILVDPEGHLQIDILTGGGGAEFAEDSPAIDLSLGSYPLTVRQDVDGSSSAGTDGDNAFLFSDSRGFLKTEIFTGGDTFDISAVSLPLPSGAATSALQLADGHNVTVDNASGASAVNIQDGGNSITVDGSLTVNPPADVELDLQVAVSATADGTTINVSGVNTVMIHVTNDGSWDRTGSVVFEGFMGASDIPEPRVLPYLEFQSVSDNFQNAPVGRMILTGAPLFALPDTDVAYMVDVRGFQGFRARLVITGGSAGTISIHAHLVTNDSGIFNTAMALVQVSGTGNSSLSDFAVQSAGERPTGGGKARTLVISNANSDVYVSGSKGVPAHGINNEDLADVVTTNLRYSPFAVDDKARIIIRPLAALPLPAGAATSALQLPDGHNVTVDNAAGGSAVNIQDGGNSITVDGVFFQATQPVSAVSLPLPSGASTLAAQLADGHNVTVDNAAGGSAVNIQDGGNSITVDGTFFQATQPVSGANSNAKINCTANAFLNMTTATTTQIVGLVAAQDIFVCSYAIVSDGVTATDVKFVSGTGADCAVSQADRSSDLPLTAATDTVGIARASGEGMIIKSDAAGDALCVTSSGAATIGVDISYAQF